MEWRAHVPQGEHVLPGWEDSVDVAAWLIDPEGLVRGRPCRWPRR